MERGVIKTQFWVQPFCNKNQIAMLEVNIIIFTLPFD